MAHVHTVVEGDTIQRLAHKAGFRQPLRVYEHIENIGLRALRPNPNQLAVGDKVYIPDKEVKRERCTTNDHHMFMLIAERCFVELRLQGFAGRSLAGMKYQLVVGKDSFEDVVPLSQTIRHDVEIDATDGTLTLFPTSGRKLKLALKIGFLEPASTDAGAQARLANLGYYHGDLNGDMGSDRSVTAMDRFRADNNEVIMGRDRPLDGKTRAWLEDEHGS